MLEKLNILDTELFLFLNGLHHPLLDSFMIFISYNYTFMGLLLLVLLGFTIKEYKKKFFIAFVALLIGFGMSDSISSRVFKPSFERLRPCHQPELANKVHLAGKKCWGGKYGFFSSHASNSFTISMFFWLLLRRKSKYFKFLFLYSTTVAYSRVYLAKHFPGDIICGALFGVLCGFLAFKFFVYCQYYLSRLNSNQHE